MYFRKQFIEWNYRNGGALLPTSTAKALRELERKAHKWAEDLCNSADGSNSDETILRDCGLTADATDEEIADAAEDCHKTAKRDGVILAGDVADVLRAVVARVKHAAEP